jgi:CDP-paratose 2-epimerase
VTTEFSTRHPGSLYGASKLSAEALVENWADEVGASAVINRCGVVTGPGQFGNSSQGFFQYFVEACRAGHEVTFRGWGGHGKQVRDILYIDDLVSLLDAQIFPRGISDSKGIWNVSGGVENSVSLRELVGLLESRSESVMDVRESPLTPDYDLAWLVLDSRQTRKRFSWEPKNGLEKIVDAIWRSK